MIKQLNTLNITDLTSCGMTIIGDTEEKNLVEELMLHCVELGNLCLTKHVLLFLDEPEMDFEDFDMVAVPFSKLISKSQNVITYSFTNYNADVVALNVQYHPYNMTFELMAGFAMARVFVKNESEYPMNVILQAGAALYAGGAKLIDIVSALNAILK